MATRYQHLRWRGRSARDGDRGYACRRRRATPRRPYGASAAAWRQRVQSSRGRIEHRPASAVESTSNIAYAAYPGLPLAAETRQLAAAMTSRSATEDRRGTDRGFNSCHIESTRTVNRTSRTVRRVITAGQAWCPRQDSNLRSRLRRPVDVVIADAFRRPGWAFCSRPASLVASSVLWFVPRGIPRRMSSVDEFEALLLSEVASTGRTRCVTRPSTRMVSLTLSPISAWVSSIALA
jgi:hypothetical protein